MNKISTMCINLNDSIQEGILKIYGECSKLRYVDEVPGLSTDTNEDWTELILMQLKLYTSTTRRVSTCTLWTFVLMYLISWAKFVQRLHFLEERILFLHAHIGVFHTLLLAHLPASLLGRTCKLYAANHNRRLGTFHTLLWFYGFRSVQFQSGRFSGSFSWSCVTWRRSIFNRVLTLDDAIQATFRYNVLADKVLVSFFINN